MSSLVRRIQRRMFKSVIGARPDKHKQTDTHFMTCHPTKGWRKISMKRVRLGI